jgi:hypothetical protein
VTVSRLPKSLHTTNYQCWKGFLSPVGQGLLIVETLRSHSDTPHSVGLLWTSDQPFIFIYLLLHAPLHCVILHAGYTFISCMCGFVLRWISALCCFSSGVKIVYHYSEWSACRRDLYLTTHNTHKGQIPMPPAEFEPAIPERERLKTHALDGAATGIGVLLWHSVKYDRWISKCLQYQIINVQWCMLQRTMLQRTMLQRTNATTNDATTNDATMNDATKNECYQRTQRNTIDRRSTRVRMKCRAFPLWLELLSSSLLSFIRCSYQFSSVICLFVQCIKVK